MLTAQEATKLSIESFDQIVKDKLSYAYDSIRRRTDECHSHIELWYDDKKICEIINKKLTENGFVTEPSYKEVHMGYVDLLRDPSIGYVELLRDPSIGYILNVHWGQDKDLQEETCSKVSKILEPLLSAHQATELLNQKIIQRTKDKLSETFEKIKDRANRGEYYTQIQFGNKVICEKISKKLVEYGFTVKYSTGKNWLYKHQLNVEWRKPENEETSNEETDNTLINMISMKEAINLFTKKRKDKMDQLTEDKLNEATIKINEAIDNCKYGTKVEFMNKDICDRIHRKLKDQGYVIKYSCISNEHKNMKKNTNIHMLHMLHRLHVRWASNDNETEMETIKEKLKENLEEGSMKQVNKSLWNFLGTFNISPSMVFSKKK